MEERFVDQKINSKTNFQIHNNNNNKIEVISSCSYRSAFGSQGINQFLADHDRLLFKYPLFPYYNNSKPYEVILLLES